MNGHREEPARRNEILELGGCDDLDVARYDQVSGRASPVGYQEATDPIVESRLQIGCLTQMRNQLFVDELPRCFFFLLDVSNGRRPRCET